MFTLPHRLFLSDDHVRELFTKSGINLVFRLAGMLLEILFVWIVIRWFGSAAFGNWAVTLTILSIGTVLVNLGISMSMVLLVAKARVGHEPGRLRDAYLKSLMLISFSGLLVGLCLFAAGNYISQVVFNKPDLEPLLRIAAFGVLPLNIVILNSSALRGLRQITAHSFLESAGKPLFAIVMLVAGYAAFSHGQMFALAYVGALWLLAGVSFVLWVWLSDFMKLPRSPGRLTYRQLFDLSLPMFIFSAVNLVRDRTDIIIIGLFWSDVELAAYSLVIRVSALITLPLFAINSIAAPKFAEFHSLGDVAAMGLFARQSTRIIFWLSTPIFIVLVLFNKSVLSFFESGLTIGALALLIVALGQFFNAISGSVGPILNMSGHQRAIRDINLLVTALNLVLNCILIPKYGIEGAAIVTCLTLVLSNALCLYRIKKEFNFVPIYLPGLFK